MGISKTSLLIKESRMQGKGEARVRVGKGGGKNTEGFVCISKDFLRWFRELEDRKRGELILIPWNVSCAFTMATKRCADCDIGVMQFFHKYVGQTKDLLDFCIRHKLVLDKKECEVCGEVASLYNPYNTPHDTPAASTSS